MLHVLLMILEIVGIVLLIVLGIVIVLLLCILFVPVRYKLVVRKYPEKDWEAYVRVSWLLHVLHGVLSFQEDLTYKLRLFGVSIAKGDFSEEEVEDEEVDISDDFSEKEDANKIDASKKKTTIAIEEQPSEMKCKEEHTEELPLQDSDKALDQLEENAKLEKKSSDELSEEATDIEKHDSETETKVERDEKPKGILKKIGDIVWNIKVFLEKGLRSCRTIWKGVTSSKNTVVDKLVVVKDALFSEKIKQGFAFLHKHIVKLLVHIWPKKWGGYVRFGMDDPAATGKALAALSVVYGVVGVMPSIEPDFTQEILEVDLTAKGRIRISFLLRIFIKVWFSEEFNQVKSEYKKARRA